MDAAKINQYLQRAGQRKYRARVGEEVAVELPRVPFTAETEFLVLRTVVEGDAVESSRLADAPEGRLLPEKVVGKALRRGKSRLIVTAYDSLTNQPVDGVEPLDIEIEVDP